jgi:pimeloyl-ACP methyl ester carboxylesterase
MVGMMGMCAITGVAAVMLALYAHNQREVRRAENAFPPRGSFVTAEGLRLHYVCQGAGQPVVLLHGGILSSCDYAGVLELAAEAGFRAIAFDRPGYGYSERPRRDMATPAVQARLLREALSVLKAERPVLVAHSWSGSLALAYALAYPDEIAGLVLLAPGAYAGDAYPAGTADLLIGRLLRVPWLGGLLANTVLSPLARLLAKPMVTAAFSPDPVPPGYLERARALWSRPGQLRANREDILAYVRTVPQWEPRYADIRTPVVIVVGDADPFHPALQAGRLHREIGHSRLVVLPGTAHMIPDVRPEAVVEAVHMVLKHKQPS